MAERCVVIDAGSGSIKVGFNEQDTPLFVIPTLVGSLRSTGEHSSSLSNIGPGGPGISRPPSTPKEGRSRSSSPTTPAPGFSLGGFLPPPFTPAQALAAHSSSTVSSIPLYLGDEANERRGELTIRSPIHRGIITDWGEMEQLFRLVLDKLDPDLSEFSVVLTEPYLFPKTARQKLFELWFEKLQANAVASCTQPLLSLFSLGVKSALILEIGEGLMQIAAIVNDTPIEAACARYHFAGADITENVVRLLAFRGHPLRTSPGREIARDIKEQVCYVAFDPKEEAKIAPSSLLEEYQLPDGRVITIAEERHQAVEPLFAPSLVGSEASPLPKLIFDTIMSHCPIDVRRELFGNIFLCGGGSVFPGLADRLQKELLALVPPSIAVKVNIARKPLYSAWLGACALSLLGPEHGVWFYKSNYDEMGSSFLSNIPNNPFSA